MEIGEYIPKSEVVRYVVLGSVDSGKTTFLGVMEKQVLDDGNGYARSLITRLKHEIESRRTSSATPHYLICGNEITTLIDLCGHDTYFKTTMYGVMGLFPDYAIIMVAANMGVTVMTIEHMKLLFANKIPFMVIITKTDICPDHVLEETKKNLIRVAKLAKKSVMFITDNIESDFSSNPQFDSVVSMFHERKNDIVPAIHVSNKTGYNINFVRNLIMSIKSKYYLQKISEFPIELRVDYPMVMYTDSIFNVPGIGIVLSGTVKYGTLRVGQKLFLGPVNKTYIGITVKTLCNCIGEHIEVAPENESASIGIRLDSKVAYSKEMFSKGQIVTSDMGFAMRYTCYTFNCQIKIFNHSTTIRDRYQTVIHCGSVRQTAQFKVKEAMTLRSGSTGIVNVKFIRKPEFILPNTIFMFRDGQTKGMGVVLSCVPFTQDSLDQTERSKRIAFKQSARKKAKADRKNKKKIRAAQ